MKRIRKSAAISHVNVSFVDGTTKSLVQSRQDNGEIFEYVQSVTASVGILIENSSRVNGMYKSRINNR